MPQLINQAAIAGNIGADTINEQSAVTVELNDVWFNKTADKQVWTDGMLTYSIDIMNNDDPAEPSTDPLANGVFTDIIDPDIATVLVDTIVVTPAAALSGTPQYNAATGELTINFNDIAVGDAVNVTFQVARKLP